MNSFVLMAKIVRSPQLRYTQNGELAITEMMVEFENPSPNTPPCNLKVIGWGNLATEIEQKYHEGDQVILSGRLKIDTIERQEGFKEKKAELTVSSIVAVNSSSNDSIKSNSSSSDNVVKIDSYKSSTSVTERDDFEPENSPIQEEEITQNSYPESSESNEQDLDHIPF
jgi:single-stranded DNA-binding protein